jgi:large subunit ribosomal protein L6
MSRIGKKPVALPAGVQVTVRDGQIAVKGPKGELKRPLPTGITAQLEGGQVLLIRGGDSRFERSRHGLARSLIANMVKGVTDGFVRQLEINGVGYRAEVTGNKINLAVGLSHPVEYALPTGIQAKSEKTKSTVNPGQDAVLLTLTGVNNEVLGQFVSKIRSTRPPEPYKGKGIKFLHEKIRRKVGKTGAS